MSRREGAGAPTGRTEQEGAFSSITGDVRGVIFLPGATCRSSDSELRIPMRVEYSGHLKSQDIADQT